jgi:hypothetical protein
MQQRAPLRLRNCFLSRRGGVVFWEGEFTMSRFDQDTSTMRMRMENTLIELRKPEIGPQSKARGILVGAVLGVLAWAAIITLGMAVWRWLE